MSPQGIVDDKQYSGNIVLETGQEWQCQYEVLMGLLAPPLNYFTNLVSPVVK